tara:strand:+ start:230 stop:796 length:567 start_codon:yes stop_codon:yes gene_type:complete
MMDIIDFNANISILICLTFNVILFIQSCLIAQRAYSNTKIIKKYTNPDRIQRFKDRIDTFSHKLDELVDTLNNTQDITEEEIEKTKVKFDDFNYKIKEIFEKIDGMNYNQLSKLVLRLSDRIKIIEQNYDEYVPDLDIVDEYTEKIIDTEKEDMIRENTSLKKQVKKLNERLEVFASSPKTLRNGKTY